MALSTETRNYEILIRFHKDGSVGAHKQDIQSVEDDGVLISEKALPAQALQMAELKSLVASL